MAKQTKPTTFIHKGYEFVFNSKGGCEVSGNSVTAKQIEQVAAYAHQLKTATAEPVIYLPDGAVGFGPDGSIYVGCYVCDYKTLMKIRDISKRIRSRRK